MTIGRKSMEIEAEALARKLYLGLSLLQQSLITQIDIHELFSNYCALQEEKEGIIDIEGFTLWMNQEVYTSHLEDELPAEELQEIEAKED